MTSDQLGKAAKAIRLHYGLSRPITSYEVEVEIANLLRKSKSGTQVDSQEKLQAAIEVATGCRIENLSLPYIKFQMTRPQEPNILEMKQVVKGDITEKRFRHQYEQRPAYAPDLPTVEHLKLIGNDCLEHAAPQWMPGEPCGRAWFLKYDAQRIGGFDFIRRPILDGDDAALPYAFRTCIIAEEWRKAAIEKLKRNLLTT